LLNIILYIFLLIWLIFLQISRGNIEKNIVAYFIKPFVIYLASTDDQRQIKHIVANIFRYLIFQSDIGMDYTEKFNTWKQVCMLKIMQFQ
jgi:hypothetical protein